MATKTKNSLVSTTIKGTTDKTEVENLQKTLTPPDASTPESDSLSLSQLIPNSAADDVEGAENGADSNAGEALIVTEATNDVDKKARRAERFGVPLQLSEQEKRNSRADRFGTVSALDGGQSSEDLKRKARADRFCQSANANVDEDAKKKARLARFGPNVKVDTQEEEKRKARALRFASSPVSANGKQNVEMENAVPGNTAGDT